jgi:hypothetical protein
MADGQMAVLPVAFSLMASFMSAITLLGVSQVLGSMLLRASAQKQRAIPANVHVLLHSITLFQKSGRFREYWGASLLRGIFFSFSRKRGIISSDYWEISPSGDSLPYTL